MPGITGIIVKSQYDGIRQDLLMMVEAMRHEPHYSGGQYVNEELGLYLGWMCQKGSFADCMPLVSINRDVVLIFQGENYPDKQTIERLRSPARRADVSNAKYLLDLYMDFGDDFFRHLNGWYCGVVVNLRSGKITLFNDRYGMGRIYFHEGKDEFLFGSEAKSLLKARPVLRAIGQENLAEYLRFNCVTRNKTLFPNVFLLPNASAWEFDHSVVPRKRRYFDFSEWEQQPTLSSEEFYSKFCDTVSRVFPTYLQGPGMVAFSLTAGLDTRAIMASLGERIGALPGYTFGGNWGELFDIRTGRKLAKIYNQPFRVIHADEAFLKGFSDFATRTVHISDGTHDAFDAHDVYLNQVAREIAPVRLTGKFGSEVVRVRNLVPFMAYQRDLLRPELLSIVEALRPFAQARQAIHPLTRVVSEEIPLHEFGRVAIEQSQLVLRTPYMDNELVRLMFQAPTGVRAAGNLQEEYVRDRNPQFAEIPTNLGRFVSHSRLVTQVAYSWLWALFKVEYIYLYATPHWLTRLDRTLGKLRLERVLSGRQKWEGYRIWAKTNFADFIRQTLLNPGTHYTHYFEKAVVERMVRRHTAGTHNYVNEINRVLTVELIFSTLLRP
jgi:asparagine synthase (glutamine-hydrolysing)